MGSMMIKYSFNITSKLLNISIFRVKIYQILIALFGYALLEKYTLSTYDFNNEYVVLYSSLLTLIILKRFFSVFFIISYFVSLASLFGIHHYFKFSFIEKINYDHLLLATEVFCSLVEIFIFNKKSRRGSIDPREYANILKIYQRNPSKAGYRFEKLANKYFNGIYQISRHAEEVRESGEYPKALRMGGGDKGVDLIASDQDNIYIIQVKLKGRGNKVKGDDIAKTSVVSDIFRTHYQSIGDNREVVPLLFTNGHLDSTAKSFVKTHKVRVIDSDKFTALMT
ncbi:MAG: restriction endonuclease [Oligoflexia bacterium]|nr:restriction endonuclease [Oligoflexia bacterium]